jgi:lipopolysaccharide assembly outer membrane protein LptD (OstA)
MRPATPRFFSLMAALAVAVGPVGPAAAAPAKPPVKAPVKAQAPGEKIHITSDYMKYDRKAKVALATGNVVILQEDTTIRTAEVQFDQGQKISYMNQPVKVVQQKEKEPRTTLDSQRMTSFHKDKRILAEGSVKMVRAKDPYARSTSAQQRAKVEAAIKKQDTVITADKLEYWTQKKDASFTGNVVIINDQKKSWGDTAFMDKAKNTITLNGKVRVVQINGNWLVKEGIVKADKPDEARDEALRERATLTCDKLVIDQNTNDAVATGNIVRVEQKGKVATGRKAVFSDKDSTITMTENVRIQQTNGDWLTATKAVFHTNTEVFEAFSGGNTQVQTEFDVPDQKPKPNDGRVQMEFDVDETEK